MKSEILRTVGNRDGSGAHSNKSRNGNQLGKETEPTVGRGTQGMAIGERNE